jgi:Zn-dependent protease
MTMTRAPGGAPAGRSADPDHGNSGPGVAGFSVRLTTGGYLLMVAALLVSGLSLPVAAPGWPAAAYLAAAASVALLFLVSVILHELAHAIAARRYGIRAGHITIGFLGGATHGRYDLPGPRGQWRIAAAGPAASLVMAGICAAAAFGLATVGAGRLAVLAVTAAAWLNVLLGVFSGLPGVGPDGGRIVRALTWARTGDPARSGLVAARTGQITGAVLAAVGLGGALLGHPAGLWAGLVGVLAVMASRAESRQLRTAAALSGLRVRDIAPPPGSPDAVPQAWQTVQAFLDGEGDGLRPGLADVPAAVPIRDFDGRPAGILTLSQLAAVPPDRRDSVRLSEVATPLAQVVTTGPDEPLPHLLDRLRMRPAIPAALHTAGHALVLSADGSAAGVLTPADFARASQLGALRMGRGKRAGQ